MKKLIVALVAILIVIGGIFLLKLRKQELLRLKPPKIYPVVVDTFRPKESNFYLSLTGLGVIESSANVNIVTKLSGRILYIKSLGDRVRKGEIIVRIDSTSTRARLSSIKAELASLYSRLKSAELKFKNSVLTHRRTGQLLKVNGASIEQYQKEENDIAALESEVSSIKSKIKSLKNNVKNLENLLSYSILRSPVDGIVSKRILNVGDVVMPGKTIMQISSKGNKYILVLLPDDIRPKGIIFHGKFYKVFELNSTFNGLDRYKANVRTDLSAGSRVEISVVVFKGRAIKLPFNAVLNDNGKNLVFILRSGKAIPERVKIVASGEQGLAVLDRGLLGKQLIIAKPDIFIKILGGVKVIKE